MSARSTLFRERALQQGDVREALDERVRIVGVPRWIALAIAVLVIVGLLAWSGSSAILQTVDVQGVVSSDDGVPMIVSPVSGTVIRSPPQRGSRVSPGEVVATVDDGRGAPVPVRATTAGSIETVLTVLGAFVKAGGELATIVPAAARPVGFIFVPTREVAQLRVGMKTLLSPEVLESRATGLLEGRIIHIANFPATPDRLSLLLGPVLASKLEAGPPVQEVEIGLTPDPSTPSRYAWTNGTGPPTVAIGTPVSGRVQISRESPLSYAF